MDASKQLSKQLFESLNVSLVVTFFSNRSVATLSATLHPNHKLMALLGKPAMVKQQKLDSRQVVSEIKSVLLGDLWQERIMVFYAGVRRPHFTVSLVSKAVVVKEAQKVEGWRLVEHFKKLQGDELPIKNFRVVVYASNRKGRFEATGKVLMVHENFKD